jgi:glycosyltransferase involved in cell wall biosynthesis
MATKRDLDPPASVNNKHFTNTVHISTDLSVIIPVYNQQKDISASIERIKQILNSTLLRYEIIIVDDGSCDDTLTILRDKLQLDSNVKIISYQSNKGKGYAIKNGIMQSVGDIIILVDGDLDVDLSPQVIHDYVKELKIYDIVIASKRHPLSKVKTPISRKVLSRLFNILVRMTLQIKIKDTQAGLKAANGEKLRTIFKVILVKRYAFDIEMLVVASGLSLNIKEMPIEINLTKRFAIKEIVKMSLDLAFIFYRFKIKRWYQKQLESLQPEMIKPKVKTIEF